MQYAIKSGQVIYERFDHVPMPEIAGAEYLYAPDDLAGWFRGEDGLGSDPRGAMPPDVLARLERAALLQDLADLDALAIRPLRAMVAGTASQVDRDRLESLEAVARVVREELAEVLAWR